LNNTQETHFQTKKKLSENQNEKMNDHRFTTREKNRLNIEKIMPAEKRVSVPVGVSPPVFDFNFIEQTNPAAAPANKQKQVKFAKKSLIKTQGNTVSSEQVSEADKIVNAVLSVKKCIVEEVSANFEQKLEKLDEAIIELISCKAENERLKGKIDNMTKENYKLKKEIKNYRQIMPGFFIKVKKDEFDF